ERNCCPLLQGDPIVYRDAITRIDDDVLGVASLALIAQDTVIGTRLFAAGVAELAAPATAARNHHDGSADIQQVDTGTDLVNRPADFTAEDVRNWRDAGNALPDPQIQMIHAAAGDAHPDLAMSRLGIGDL